MLLLYITTRFKTKVKSQWSFSWKIFWSLCPEQRRMLRILCPLSPPPIKQEGAALHSILPELGGVLVRAGTAYIVESLTLNPNDRFGTQIHISLQAGVRPGEATGLLLCVL